MTRLVSVRNGWVAELVSKADEQVVLKMEDGKEISISPVTLKRWWKEIEEPQTEEITSTDEVVAEVDPVIEEEPVAKVEKKAKAEKASKQKHETISGDHPLKDYIEQLATERGTEVFKATVPSFRSLKVDGKMYMALTFNKKGVTLWMRSKAVQDLTQYRKTNHMFDARVHFDEETKGNKEKITKLLDASLEFQKNKQAGKASKQ